MNGIFYTSLFLFSLPLPILASISIVSPQFESLCRTNKQECKSIRIHSKVGTDLIYHFFDADRLKDINKLEEISQEIKTLLDVSEIKVVNRRIPLSQFFTIDPKLIFGGYAILGRNQVIAENGVTNAKYHIIVKGLFNELEDPNDIIAAISGIPDSLYGQAAIKLHQGMKNYAQAIFLSPEFQSLLTEIIELQKDEKNNIEITLSGHSLGASCILIAALMKDRGVKPENIKIITFGGPSFLQRGFIDRYSSLFSRTTRVELEGDMLNNEIDSPLFPVYAILNYLAFGNLIKGTVPRAKYKQVQSQIIRLSTGKLSEDKLTELANLTLEALSERVQIHVFGYRRFFDSFSE